MSSISTPTSLATFANPHASGSKHVRPHVAMAPVHGGQPGLAVAAVQGDGVWTYDLNTLRPTTSFTVPPGTAFSTPALSWVPSPNKRKGKQRATEETMEVDGADLNRMTIVGLHKGEGVNKGEEGQKLWMWSGEDPGKRENISLPCAAQALHLVQPSSSLVLIVGHDGELLLLDNALSIRPIAISSPKRALKSVRISRVLSSTVVLVDSAGLVVKIALSLDNLENPTGHVLREGRLLEQQRKPLLTAVDIDDDGLVTAVVGDELVSFDVNNPPSPSIYPRLKHTSSTPLVLSLPSLGGKPLAIFSYEHPSPSLLLVTPSASLASVLLVHDLSTISHGGNVAALSLISRPSANTFVIGVIIAHHTANEGRSVIHTCELTIPPLGIGMNALLGSRQRSSEYIRFQDFQGAEDLGKGDKVLVKHLSETLGRGDKQAATNLWAKHVDARPAPAVSESLAKEVVREVLGSALPTAVSKSEAAVKGAVYAQGIVTDLLTRRALNDAMWEGGLVLAGLLPLQDWDNIRLAVKTISSLPPATIVSLLKESLSSSNPASTPTIRTLFADVLSLPAPGPTYRPELRRELSVQEATVLLDCLVEWAEKHVANIGKDFAWNTETTVPETACVSTLEGVPSLNAIIIHASVLLDAHLPSFLTHEPSFDSLARLQAAIQPLLALQEDFDRLRAPIDAVITLARREERRLEQEAKKAARSRADKSAQQNVASKGDTRKGGRLPEEMVGKWRVEDFVF